MANGDLSLYKALSVGRPWVLGIQNQVVSYCGVGICDALLANSVSALEPFRYATGLFSWASVATQNNALIPPAQSLANHDGNDLAIASGQEVDLFTSGVGEAIPGGWWIQTISDTDLFRSGAPVDRGFMFLVTGVTFSSMDVFQRGDTGTSATDSKMYSNFLEGGASGPGYGFLIQKFHINYTAMQMTFGDTGCSYRIGIGAFWPDWGHPTGQQTVGNGVVATPGMYLPFTTAVCIGARDDVKQLTLTLTTGQAGRVQNNPAQPTISGSLAATNVTINGVNDGTVHAPVRVVTVGYIVCVPYADYCGIPTLTPDEVVLLRQRLGLQTMTPSVMTPGSPMSIVPSNSIPTPP